MLKFRRVFLSLGGALASSVVALCLIGVASAFAGPTVTVRVEGESSTLLPLAAVSLEKPEPVSGCPADSATAAINLAVHEEWDHGDEGGSKGDFTETILGETHSYEVNGTTWDVWINDRWGGGICEDLLKEGEEVLLVADHLGLNYAPTRLPLVIGGVPAAVTAETPFTIDVSKITLPHGGEIVGEGEPKPEGGVTISGGGASAITDAEGVATVKLGQPGTYMLIASKAGDAPSAPVAICVRGSGESGCGVQGPSGPPTNVGSSAGGAGVLAYSSAPYNGPFAIVAMATGLREGGVYEADAAPRLLQGTVSLHSALEDVQLRLTRMQRARGGKHACSYYDGVTDRFRAMRCGAAHGRYFSIGAHASFSYLLPSALPPGRYVLDIEASDAAGNDTKLIRGKSRIVFYVR